MGNLKVILPGDTLIGTRNDFTQNEKNFDNFVFLSKISKVVMILAVWRGNHIIKLSLLRCGDWMTGVYIALNKHMVKL